MRDRARCHSGMRFAMEMGDARKLRIEQIGDRAPIRTFAGTTAATCGRWRGREARLRLRYFLEPPVAAGRIAVPSRATLFSRALNRTTTLPPMEA